MSHLTFDSSAFAAAFGKDSIAVQHDLVGHELFGLDSLARLADALPSSSIEHNLGDLPTIVGPDNEGVRSLDLSPGEIVRTIEENRSWMVLKNVEQDATYAGLLRDCLEEVRALSEPEGGMTLQEGYIFISAPNSMTPSHVDPEHNFLLQIRGTKEMHVGRFDDEVEEQLQLERIYLGGHRNLSQEPDSARCFALSPGDGVYVRPDAPHFVKNGPEPSVSFSITWRTPATARASRVHRTNGRLRKANLKPAPPGRSVARDRVKAYASSAATAVELVAAKAKRR
jgi:hypothetical protein